MWNTKVTKDNFDMSCGFLKASPIKYIKWVKINAIVTFVEGDAENVSVLQFTERKYNLHCGSFFQLSQNCVSSYLAVCSSHHTSTVI